MESIGREGMPGPMPGSDAEQRDALDKLVARANETIGSHESAPLARLVHQLADAITQLRQRVVERDRRIAEQSATIERMAVSLVKDTATMKNANDLITRQDNTLKILDKRITEALEYCEDREDIIDGEFGPLPNDFMDIATILKGRQA